MLNLIDQERRAKMLATCYQPYQCRKLGMKNELDTQVHFLIWEVDETVCGTWKSLESSADDHF